MKFLFITNYFKDFNSTCITIKRNIHQKRIQLNDLCESNLVSCKRSISQRALGRLLAFLSGRRQSETKRCRTKVPLGSSGRLKPADYVRNSGTKRILILSSKFSKSGKGRQLYLTPLYLMAGVFNRSHCPTDCVRMH